MRNIRWGAVALAFAVLSTAAVAQESGGRTDGPEGSEIGKGGYTRLHGDGKFSLTLDWGAAIFSDGNVNDTPFMLGGTASFWADDWVVLDLSGEYLFDVQGLEVLAGPRFRTPYYPLAFSAGLKAGALILTDNGLQDVASSSKAYFTLTPQVGVELNVVDHVPFGLTYALDIPIGADQVINRIFLSIGYKF
jgi:hypothetical protein